MMDMFYIFKLPKTEEMERLEGERWLLRIKDCHFTMSALNSKEEILDSLYRIVVKYGSRRELMKRVHNIPKSAGYGSRAFIDRCQSDYIKYGVEHDEDVLEVVSKALKEVAFNQPVHKIKKKVRILSVSPDLVVEEKEESTTPVAPVGKVLVSKQVGPKRLGLLRSKKQVD